jgi:hypothetical protein
MAGRGRTTFQKRQKEQMRLERRQQKAARKSERKAQKDNPEAGSIDEMTPLDAGGEVSETAPSEDAAELAPNAE